MAYGIIFHYQSILVNLPLYFADFIAVIAYWHSEKEGEGFLFPLFFFEIMNTRLNVGQNLHIPIGSSPFRDPRWSCFIAYQPNSSSLRCWVSFLLLFVSLFFFFLVHGG